MSSSSGDNINERICKWLCSRSANGNSLVKISEVKDYFPTITLEVIERLFEQFVSQGYLILEGKSRVKLFVTTENLMNDHFDNDSRKLNEVGEKKEESIPKKRIQRDDVKRHNDKIEPDERIVSQIPIRTMEPSVKRSTEIYSFDSTPVNNSHQSILSNENISGDSTSIVYQIVYANFEKTSLNGGDGTASTEDVCQQAVEAGCSNVNMVKKILGTMVELNKIMIDGDCIIEI